MADRTAPFGARSASGNRLAGRPLLIAALGAATISSSPVLVVLSGAAPAGTAFYRALLALPVLIVLAAIEQRRHGRRALAQRARAALAGVFLAVDLILWTHAIIDVGAGVATVLGNLQVLFVAGIAWALWHERPGKAVALALPVVMLGVVLVSGLLGHHGTGQHPLAGISYGIGTSIAYAGFLLTLRRSSAGSPHAAGPVTDATAAAAIASLLFGLFFGGLDLHPIWPAIGWLTLLALLSQTLGWLLITSSLPRLPAAVSSLLLLLQPGASLAIAAVVIGERPTGLQILGAFLTCGGALVASLAATRNMAASQSTPASATPAKAPIEQAVATAQAIAATPEAGTEPAT
jgi:drug/metabolite transporter (DMT)-like permease